MKPIEFPEQNVVIAKDQPEYIPLPAHVSPNGVVASCWQLDEFDLSIIAKTGKIWVQSATFNHPLQPQLLSVVVPSLPDTSSFSKE